MPRSPRRFSEHAFHAWIAREFGGGTPGPLPIGDDTAALPLGGARVALLTTDALAEGTHFRAGSPPEAIGGAAAAASLSDIAAKGGRPVGLLIDLLLPQRTDPEWAKAVLRGAASMARRHGAALVGGDTKRSEHRAVVGTVLGIGRADRLAPRSGARVGDVVVVTGSVGSGGWAARSVRSRATPTRRELRAMLAIRPRSLEGPALARFAHAALDTSDGVAESARLLAAASGCRVVVGWEQLPLLPRVASLGSRVERQAAAFYGGDYELLAAVPPAAVGAAARALRRLGCPLTPIGRVERGRGAWLLEDGQRRPMPAGGWDPFLPGR